MAVYRAGGCWASRAGIPGALGDKIAKEDFYANVMA